MCRSLSSVTAMEPIAEARPRDNAAVPVYSVITLAMSCFVLHTLAFYHFISGEGLAFNLPHCFLFTLPLVFTCTIAVVSSSLFSSVKNQFACSNAHRFLYGAIVFSLGLIVGAIVCFLSFDHEEKGACACTCATASPIQWLLSNKNNEDTHIGPPHELAMNSHSALWSKIEKNTD